MEKSSFQEEMEERCSADNYNVDISNAAQIVQNCLQNQISENPENKNDAPEKEVLLSYAELFNFLLRMYRNWQQHRHEWNSDNGGFVVHHPVIQRKYTNEVLFCRDRKLFQYLLKFRQYLINFSMGEIVHFRGLPFQLDDIEQETIATYFKIGSHGKRNTYNIDEEVYDSTSKDSIEDALIFIFNNQENPPCVSKCFFSDYMFRKMRSLWNSEGSNVNVISNRVILISNVSNRVHTKFERKLSWENVSSLEWLNKDGLYTILSLEPTRTIQKLKLYFSNIRFIHYTINDVLENMYYDNVIESFLEKSVVLVDCGNCVEETFMKVLNRVKNFGRCVLVTNNTKPKLSLCSLIIDEYKWEELEFETRSYVLKNCVKFQGHNIKLETLLPNTDDDMHDQLMDSLSPDTLLHIATNDVPVFCKNTLHDLPKVYQPRRLVEWSKINITDGPTTNVSEKTFVKQLCQDFETHDNFFVCIVGSYASGKTTLLMKIGQLLQSSSHFASSRYPKIVQYIRVIEILIALRERDITSTKQLSHETILEILCSIITDNHIVKHYINMECVNCELLIDEIDMVPYCYMDLLFAFFSVMQQFVSIWKKFRVWLVVENKFKTCLEKYLNLKCYKLLPLLWQDVQHLLIMMRYVHQTKPDANFNAFNTVQQNFGERKRQKELSAFEKEITGTPLYCRLLALVYYKAEYIIHEFPEGEIPLWLLLEKCIKHTLQKESAGKIKFTTSTILTRLHEKLALQMLFPQHVETFDVLFPSETSFHNSNISKLGIMDELDTEMKNPVFMHRTFAEYLVAKFACEMATQECLDDPAVLKAVTSLFVDILIGTWKCDISITNSSEFWHHNTTEKIPSTLLYHLESLVDHRLNKNIHSLNKIFDNICKNVSFPKLYEMLATLSRDRPTLAKLISQNVYEFFKPIRPLMVDLKGCTLLPFLFKNSEIKSEVQIQQIIEKISSPQKLMRFLLENDIIDYCRKEYDILELSNGKFNKYQKYRIQAVENAFYWKLITQTIQKRYPKAAIDSLTIMCSHWFSETESDISKLKIVNKFQNEPKWVYEIRESLFEEFFLAEFVFRMATYGKSVNSMRDAMIASVNIFLSAIGMNKFTDIDKQSNSNSQFSFLAILNELLEQQDVKSNFISEVRRQICECYQASIDDQILSVISPNITILNFSFTESEYCDKLDSEINIPNNIKRVLLNACANKL